MTHPIDVVITGIGVVSPIGIGIDAFWDGLVSGRSGVSDLGHVNQDICPFDFGGQLREFDPKAHVKPRKALKVMCRELQTAFASSALAIEHSGLDTSSMPADRIGTVFGSEMLYGEVDELQPTFARACQEGKFRSDQWGSSAMREIFPLWMLKYLPNMAACHVGIALGALGPNNSIVMGDTSGLSAVGEAMSVIQRGVADVVVACSTGTRVSLTRLLYRGDLPYASRRDPVETSSRPFASDRDGVVGGEGSGAVILESREHAERRGAKPLAQIAGFASSFVPPASGTRGSKCSIAQSLESVIYRAGLTGKDIGIAVSHAMGDRDLDRAEAEALAQIAPNAVVTAPKGAMGHPGAGCGVIELGAAAYSLHNGIVPPTVNAADKDSTLSINLAEKATGVEAKAAVQLNHTAIGNSVAVALKKIL